MQPIPQRGRLNRPAAGWMRRLSSPASERMPAAGSLSWAQSLKTARGKRISLSQFGAPQTPIGALFVGVSSRQDRLFTKGRAEKLQTDR